MNKCPLLLKYRIRNCYHGKEACFVPSIDEYPKKWTPYEDRKLKVWRIRLPDSKNFIRETAGGVQYFYRHEYSVAGDPNPILFLFQKTFKAYYETEQTYQLKKNYIMHDCYYLNHGWWNDDIQKCLSEYERCRDDWETRIIIGERS